MLLYLIWVVSCFYLEYKVIGIPFDYPDIYQAQLEAQREALEYLRESE